MRMVRPRPTRLVPVSTAVCAALAWCLLTVPPLVAQGQPAAGHWVGTWATAAMARPAQPQGASQLTFDNQTLRQIVRVSLGGDRVRVVFTNAFASAPLKIGAAHVALRAKDAAIVPASSRALTFGGQPTTTIPAGAVVVSDPVTLDVAPLADLAIDLYLPDKTATDSPVTVHAAAWQTNYVSPPGNHAGKADMPVQATTTYARADGQQTSSWFYLARVEVMAPEQVGAVVALGDSITDGTASGIDTNNRWPNHLARRLAAQNRPMGILNVGIGGNRLLSDGFGAGGLARFDRDVLGQPGVTHLVVMLGINDIGMAGKNPSPTADELIAGHKQLIERARAHGLRIYGATLTPFEGAAYWTAEGEAKRKAVNEWIRTSKAYDAVIDFDAVVRDPKSPTKFLPQYDPGDHLHPNAAGYKAMAEAIDLTLFATRESAATASK